MSVRVGVIGVGIMGAAHARTLATEVSAATVTAVHDADRARAVDVATELGAHAASDPVELMHRDDVDAVVIASVDSTHERFVLAALDAGTPVLCEKPLAPTVEACERIVDAEVRGGRRMVDVGFMRRFDPGYRRLRRELTGGDMGAPLLMHCVHRNRSAAAGLPSAMLITGSAVHEFDVARWLLDDEPVAVTVHRPRASARAGGTQDPIMIVLETASGVLVDVEVFVNAAYGYEVRCELVGENGTALLDTPAPTVVRRDGSAGRAVADDWRDRFGEAYRLELQAWVDAVDAGRPSTLASARDGYVATVMAEAAVRALDSGATEKITLVGAPELYA